MYATKILKKTFEFESQNPLKCCQPHKNLSEIHNWENLFEFSLLEIRGVLYSIKYSHSLLILFNCLTGNCREMRWNCCHLLVKITECSLSVRLWTNNQGISYVWTRPSGQYTLKMYTWKIEVEFRWWPGVKVQT